MKRLSRLLSGALLVALCWPSPGLAKGGAVNVKSFNDRGIMMFGDNSQGGRPFAKDPSVVKFKGRYFLYYSVPTEKAKQGSLLGWRVGIATSRDLVTWRKVTTMQPEHASEQNGFCAPGAIVLDGKVHLFYQTYGNREKDAVCHAWSTDGINFTRDPTNPIFRPQGRWTCGRAIDAEVFEDGDRLLLYFASRDPSYKTQLVGVAAAPRRSDLSCSCWKLLADRPVLAPRLPWEKKCIEAPAVLRRSDRLFMFYAGAYNNEPQQIGCAVSDDGIRWKRLSKKPFLANGRPGSWNASESGHPGIFQDDDGRTYLFYQGNADQGKSWYLSKLEIGWKNGRPVIAGPVVAR
ncbi:MAG: hypothetical protein RIQ71_852 [Verrucomicrobiota bacterium]|jgi:predicted GH43/DUF377 family glycosyl hydrolase